MSAKIKKTTMACCTTRFRRFVFCFLAILCCFSLGCGSQAARPVHVAGVVLLDGKPLENATIRVVPSHGRPAVSSIGSAGRFTLSRLKHDDGCFPGNYRVEVLPITPEGQPVTLLIPAKYGSVETSGLTVKIDGPTNTLTINLSTKDATKP